MAAVPGWVLAFPARVRGRFGSGSFLGAGMECDGAKFLTCKVFECKQK